MTTTKFSLGQIVATPGALEAFQKTEQTPTEFLNRHMNADWGDLCSEDKETNGELILHHLDTGGKPHGP